MPAPHRKALTFALFELAATHDSPGIAGEHGSAGFNLVIEVGRPNELAEPAQDSNLPLQPARVDVLPVRRDMPAAAEHQPRAGCPEVEHRLSGPVE